MSDLKLEIIKALGRILERLAAPVELQSVVNSVGDTLDDAECLALLKEHEKGGAYLRPYPSANMTSRLQ